MKRSPDNQIYALFINISRIKWLAFLLQSSSAQLDRRQVPKQRPIIDRHLVEQIAYRRDIKDNGYTVCVNPSLQILGWYMYVKGTGRR